MSVCVCVCICKACFDKLACHNNFADLLSKDYQTHSL